MRGNDTKPAAMFSYVSAEERVPHDHPLRAVRVFVDDILREMTREFDALYARHERPSIPPERLLRAQLLQLFYSIRSERLLMEQLDYNILFRWFVGLEMDEPVWVPTVFSKNRDRLLQHAVAHSFFPARRRARGGPHVGRAFHRRRHAARGVGESEEFSAEGWGHRRGRERLSRRDAEERHARVDDGSGGAVVSQVEQHGGAPGVSGPSADGEPPRPDRRCTGDDRRWLCGTRGRERDARHALATRASSTPHRGADKAYDTADFVEQARQVEMTPH